MLTKDKTKRLPVVFPINMHMFAEITATGDVPKEMHVLPVGKWNHPSYGPLVISREDIAEFKENFDRGLRKGIPITEGHDNGMSGGELPAIGWFTELIDRGANGLFAIVEWTDKGKTLLAEKAFKFFSPEFYSEYEDPETRTIHENVLVGGALTNKPYFKELEAVVMSEPKINNQFNFNETMLELKNILEKKVDELSTEEKAFLVEHKDELTDDQKETFKTALEVEDPEADPTPDPEPEADPEPTPDPEADPEPEADPDPTPDPDPTKASEFKTDGKGNVVMTAAEAKILQSKANAGYEASKKLTTSEIKAEVSKLVFSEQNSQGRFLPAQSEKVFSFMQGLNEKQRKAFSELVTALPKTEVFNEVGHGGNNEGTAFAEIESKAKKLMSEDKAMSYSDAVKRVCEENPKLANQYEKESA